MGLSFIKKDFISHSGLPLTFKVECDDLTDEELSIFADIIGKNFSFKEVYGIPRGGIRIAEQLKKYKDKNSYMLLIVDDVITTGNSFAKAVVQKMEEGWDSRNIYEIALFSRNPNFNYKAIMGFNF